MKKIFAFLLSVGAVTSAFAQKDVYKNNRSAPDVAYQEHSRYDHGQPYNSPYYQAKERDEYINRINREYEQKRWALRNDRRLNVWEKNRELANLERDRDQQLRKCREHFYDNRNNRYDDRFADNYKRH